MRNDVSNKYSLSDFYAQSIAVNILHVLDHLATTKSLRSRYYSPILGEEIKNKESVLFLL